MNDNIRKLEELTPRLPKLVNSFGSGAVAVYLAEQGSSMLGFNLWKESRIAVQRCFAPKGSVLGTHCHDETEILIVYSGRMRFMVEGVEHIIGPADILRLEPGRTHNAEALEDSWALGITIPAAEGYP